MRNGSVLDLQIGGGEVKAMVSGSEIYKVAVKVTPVSKARWRSICSDCGGAIDSLVELLQGRFSKGVMERMCQEKTGLFPSPDEIQFSCSCPDWASMCKHVAAVLYGIGARLDQQPELLFKLHKVDEKDLIAKAGEGLPLSKKAPSAEKTLGSEDLSAIFGLEMAQTADAVASLPAPAAKPKRAKKRVNKKGRAGARAGKEGQSGACPQGPHPQQYQQNPAMINSLSRKMKTKARMGLRPAPHRNYLSSVDSEIVNGLDSL